MFKCVIIKLSVYKKNKQICSSYIYIACNAGNASLTLPLCLFVILVFITDNRALDDIHK